MIFDDTTCTLGEGALWHGDRGALIWFDILEKRLHMKAPGGALQVWDFPDHVSAAGIVDRDRLVVASSRALILFDLRDGSRRDLVALEADNPVTRSNDGRADPQGGFWIGTMGLNAEPGAGSIWRYYRGELRRLFGGITITNAICFSPDGHKAHFADTAEGIIRRVMLDEEGWPISEPLPFIDLRAEGLNPDGAVIDAEGRLWSAQWGASRVACYDAHGRFIRALAFPASQISCPAFGGAGLRTLHATSARVDLKKPRPEDGMTFAVTTEAAGQAEHRVIIG
ncbi:SMP-30/gluconolactonase/LRE family protein [Paracoccus bogoriensis]|uniref:SMP-30/gluconolactonase/LRE family protein n=1 Tax=Paracoccus bogoriensis TaxID=242065 RepID=UPI001C677153|nr:SMP-30/gluconolactonase/LRE family protein [Paracoccus bogoriensis]MBW7055642.1 SMP-30/gluconolactonase/LRE family protein [Paracoccus bogoriensis]